jgi:PAS domain S-box-containing protein
MTQQPVPGAADGGEPALALDAFELAAAGIDAFELAATGLVVTDAKGCFRRVNRAFAEMLLRDQNDLVGMTFAAITCPDDLGRSNSVMADLLSGAVTTARFEQRYVRGDGSLVWVDLNIRVFVDETGAVVGLLAQYFDVSAQKAAEAELRQQQAQLFGAINDGVFVSDQFGRLTTATSRWSALPAAPARRCWRSTTMGSCQHATAG